MINPTTDEAPAKAPHAGRRGLFTLVVAMAAAGGLWLLIAPLLEQ